MPKKSKKQAHQQQGDAHTGNAREASENTVSKSNGPWRAMIAAVVVAVVAGAVLYGTRASLPAGPEVVLVPSSTDADPLVKALVDKHVAAVRERPGSAETHGDLGLVYEANAFWPEAGQCYANASRLDPENFLWSYHRAIALRETGDLKGAFDSLRVLAQEQPRFAPIHHLYGVYLLAADDVEAAERAFQRVISLAPKSPLGYTELGDVKIRQHKYDEALPLLQKAVSMDPTYKSAHYLLGLAFRGLGDREAARRELRLGEAATQRFMQDPLWTRLFEYKLSLPDRSRLFRFYVDTGRLDRAKKVVEDALAVYPNNVAMMHNLAAVHMELNRADLAKPVLMRAIALDEKNPGTYSRLARCYQLLNRLTDAVQYVERSVELKPRDLQSHSINADVFIKVGRYDEALVSVKSAIELDPGDAKLYFNRGEALAKLNRRAEARRDFEKSAALEPKSLAARLNSAMMALDLGLLNEAETAIKAAATISPDHSQVSSLRRRLSEARNR
ncbi:MAG: tetratricopeptide repeat protein [Planctomycetes bacterium]|nr:tetratricopeptide repeat protein [Planctomycetota bacterium]